MCKLLGIARSLVYYKKKQKVYNTELENQVIKIFRDSKNNYGSRKIKAKLRQSDVTVSRRSIRRIMEKYGLVSNYSVRQYKINHSKCNEDNIKNTVKREFNNRDKLEVVVSDLTYVNVNGRWNYICLLIDLFNREIIGYSAGDKKDAKLVKEAFLSTHVNLSKINIFHTDRGSEFKNKVIEEVLKTFKIQRSLSKKGCPFDNAVAEAGYKIIKTEFAFNRTFSSLEQLKLELSDYVNWYNNHRLHGSLNYMTPVKYRLSKMTE